MKAEKIDTPSGLPAYFTGPPLSKGPLPALFYFALTGRESLELQPINEPVRFLNKLPIRIFSSTIPEHSVKEDHNSGMARWAEKVKSGTDFAAPFVKNCMENLDFFIEQGWCLSEKTAAAGISRGGFLAAHFAAADPRIKTVTAFAPITRLDFLSDFESLSNHPLIAALSLDHLAGQLCEKTLRFYIGNRDTRVSTDSCYALVRLLTETAYQRGNRSPAIELILSPSIGHRGHGTAEAAFRDGANWVATKLAVMP